MPRGRRAVRRDLVREDRDQRAGRAPSCSSGCATTASPASSGKITYTQMLNRRGGIECDFTVARLAEDRFSIVTGTAFGNHDRAWIALARRATACWSRTSPRAGRASGCGGRGRATSSPPLHARRPLDFPLHALREITVGDVPVRALRVTYVGELGWELYCPMEFGGAARKSIVVATASLKVMSVFTITVTRLPDPLCARGFFSWISVPQETGTDCPENCSCNSCRCD